MSDMNSTERAEGIIESLIGAGFRTFFYCPGSRSAPFAYALAAHSAAKVHVRVDERDAAFAALGSGRAGVPAVVVVTSGTAVGNCLPAVMEAHHGQVPLVVLSADRPAVLRGKGANQTTWQPGIFGRFVGFECDLQPENEWAAQLAAVREGGAVALSANLPGPIHINVSLVEPLVSPDIEKKFRVGANSLQGVGVRPGEDALFAVLQNRGATLVVAGDLAPYDEDLWAGIAETGIPVLAEPQTVWRGHPNAVQAYARVLAVPEGLAAAVARVIVLGRPTLTRPVTGLISRDDVAVEVLDGVGEKLDLAGNVAQRWDSIENLVKTLKTQDAAWLEAWRLAGAKIATELCQDWGMHQVAQRIWAAEGDLYLGSSLTIRAFDAVSPVGAAAGLFGAGNREAAGRRVYANRGLAGIDGLVASAWGAALATGRKTRLVLGDVSLWHDMGNLGRGRLEETPNLQVIVLHNRGGQIFAGLEHGAANPEVFARYFVTEQVGHPMTVARMLAWPARTVKTLESLEDALQRFDGGLQLLEVWVT